MSFILPRSLTQLAAVAKDKLGLEGEFQPGGVTNGLLVLKGRMMRLFKTDWSWLCGFPPLRQKEGARMGHPDFSAIPDLRYC
jgi:hypothetical protein